MRALAAISICAILTSPGAALAHGTGEHGGGEVWRSVTLAGLIALHCLYAHGLRHLRSTSGRTGTPSLSRRASFVAGEVVLAVALVSPLERLAEESLSLHMVQHLLLIVVAPTLFVSARPRQALAAAIPALARWMSRHRWWPGTASMRVLAKPLPAAGLHALVLWIWHLPALFNAAVTYVFWHMSEHVMFFGIALIFWSAVLRARRDRAAFPSAFLALLITVVLGGMMGAWISLAPELLFAGAGLGGHMGLGPLEDQQLAGILMWVPAGLAYLAIALLLTAAFLRRSGVAEHRRPVGV